MGKKTKLMGKSITFFGKCLENVGKKVGNSDVLTNIEDKYIKNKKKRKPKNKNSAGSIFDLE